ncbi:thermonuclease family protein [Mycoplasmatota bacterium]|nr:thermonuclease family protein [Mycoplasmatota bacterium]
MINGLDIEIDYETIKKEVADRLVEFRLEKNLTMTQLGILTDCSHSTISEYESMTGNISIDTLVDIAKGLGVSVYDIYAFSELDTYIFDVTSYEVEYDGPIFDEKYLEYEFSDFKNTGKCAARVAKVYLVIDGDTLRVDLKENSRLRLLAIDTPETIKSIGKWGILARDYMMHLISKTEEVVIQQDVESRMRDGYGRGLCWVWLKIDGEYQLLNYIMVKSGFATVDHIDGDRLYLDEMYKAFDDAKVNKRVMWGYRYLDPYFSYQHNRPKKRYWVVVCDGDLEVVSNDYYIHDISFAKEGTRFKSKGDAKIAQRRAKFFDKFINIEIFLRY